LIGKGYYKTGVNNVVEKNNQYKNYTTEGPLYSYLERRSSTSGQLQRCLRDKLLLGESCRGLTIEGKGRSSQ
jgi:hypothetical protein